MSNPRDRIEAKLGLTGPPLQTVRDSPPAIPDHELIRRIGQGAYGEVWLARNALGTWRAVKIVYRDNFKDARPYEREFAGIRRFEPLSRSNEGFVDILQVGRDDAYGWFYYVMELADGEEIQNEAAANPTAIDRQPAILNFEFYISNYRPRTLSFDLHHRGRLPLEDCLQLGLTLSLALGHLHRHGLIHRDVKPSNIIFVGGVPKLADIGLVTEAAGANTFVGTEGFVPPEGPTSPQADLYALGKVLYEAAMGKDRNEFPEPFTQIDTDRESVSLMELNAVLLRACAPDPKKRYATAEEMHADLALLHSGGSVKRRHQFDRQFQIAKQVGAVSIAVTLLIGAAWFWQRAQTQKMSRLAEEKTTLATEKTKLAGNLARLGEENRNRIIRLDIANGVRLLDEGDAAGALLWFADALTLVTNNPAEETVHRIRIQQVLRQMPRLLLSIASSNSIITGAWSPDGKTFSLATGAREGETYAGLVRLHDATDGHVVWTAEFPAAGVCQLRFSQDGKRLLVSSSPEQAMAAFSMPRATRAAVLNTDSGKVLYQYSASDSVTGALSPDGEYLAVARSNHVIQVITAKDGTPVVELKGHSNQIAMLTFSVNSRLLASVSEDRSARLWRLPSGADAVPGLSHDRPLRRVALSDDGSRLAIAAPEKLGNVDEGPWLVQVWDAQAGKLIGSITESTLPYALFFSRGSDNRLFTGGNGPKIRVWDTRESTVSQIGEFNQDGGRCWDFSPDGTLLCLGDDGGHADLFRRDAGEHVLERCSHNGYVESARFSPDGARLLTTSDDGTAKVWGIKRESESAALTLSADLGVAGFWDTILHGRRPGPIALPLPGGVIHLIDPERLVDVARLKAQEEGNVLYSFTAGSTGRYWAVAEGKGKDVQAPDVVDLWEQKDDRIGCLQLPHPMAVAFMTFTSGDSRLVSLASDWNVRVWRTSDGQLVSIHPVPKNYVWADPFTSQGGSYWFRPDGGAMLLYLNLKDERQLGEPPSWHEQLYDPFKGRWIGSPYNPYAWASGAIEKMAFSPDGTRLAMVAGQHGAVFDLREGGAAPVQFKHGGGLQDLDWSPDGNRLLTAGLANDVKIWDAATGEQFLSPLPTGKRHNRMARWSADGRFVVSRSDDNVARVWNVATAEAVTPLLHHSGNIRWVCITPGNRLITASEPNLLRAWNLEPTVLPAEVITDYAKLLSGRRLNAGGVLLPIPAKELAELAQSLRARAPHLFE